MEDISEKAFVVKGETIAIKEQLKAAGGKWNPKYKGWIFSKKRREEVKGIIGNKKETEPVQVSERDILENKKRVLEEEQKKRIESGASQTKEEWEATKKEYQEIQNQLQPFVIQDKIQNAINEKDVKHLFASLTNLDNKQSRKSFQEITGIKLGNKKETIQQIKDFA